MQCKMMVWLTNIPAFTWVQLASSLEGVSADSLRCKTLMCGSTILAFLQHRVWRHVESLPWSLCRGDLEQNLKDLRAGPDATEHTTFKIQRLARLGYHMGALVQGLQRLGDTPWTTTRHEQAHGSAALVHRVHPEYSVGLIIARAFLHICRSCLFPPKGDTLLRRAEAKLEVLAKREPNKTYAVEYILYWEILINHL